MAAFRLTAAALLAFLATGCVDDLGFLSIAESSRELSPDHRYIVVMHDDAPRVLLENNGIDVLRELRPQRAVAARIQASALADLRRNPHIDYIEIDPPRHLQGQIVPYGVPMVQADLVSDSSASNRTVCIIDSGYALNHEDLPSTTVTGTNDPDSGGWWGDGIGHGTHVAGIIAALNNDVGVVGVLPNETVGLHIVRVADDSGAWSYASGIIGAVNACIDGGANIINMSFGGYTESITERQALQSAFDQGVLNVAAGGNAGDSRYGYPASYDSVIAVAALNKDKERAFFSNFNDQIELSAPGLAIRSTVPLEIGYDAFLMVGDDIYTAFPIQSSPEGSASGPLVNCGLALSACNGAESAVCLIERGSNSFADKVLNCEAGGGVAAIIFNNVPGALEASLGDAVTSIPSIGALESDGQELLGRLHETAVISLGQNNYMTRSGTSMAAPYVSGVAALVWSHDPGWTNQEVREALQETAEDLGSPGRNDLYGYGLVRAAAALNWLRPVQQVESPVFSLDPSLIYTTAQEVTLQTSTPDANIRYTLDDTEPTESSSLYSSPIFLAPRTETLIRARAFREDWLPSDESMASYRVTDIVSAPSITPTTGTYFEAQQVRIETTAPGATTHYSLNGTDPSTDEPTYEEPLLINESSSMSVCARSFREDWEPSETTCATVTVTGYVEPPVFFPEEGVHEGPISVSIATPTEEATIRYTTDGSDPDQSAQPYTAPIEIQIGATNEIRARAFRERWGDSAVAGALFRAVEPISIRDDAGEIIWATEIEAGDAFFFRIAGGSGEHEVSVRTEEGLTSPSLESSEGGYVFTAAAEAAFAGNRGIVAVDSLTNGSARLTVHTPLDVLAAPTLATSEGDRIELTVRGGPPDTVYSFELLDREGSILSDIGTFVSVEPASDASSDGNPALAVFEAASVTERVDFRARVHSGGMWGLSNAISIDPHAASDHEPSSLDEGGCGCQATATGESLPVILLALAMFFCLRPGHDRRKWNSF